MQIRTEFEEIRNSTLERDLQSADEALAKYQAAVALFELGLRLGKEKSAEAETLSSEMKRYLSEREKQLHDAIYPKFGTGSRKAGG